LFGGFSCFLAIASMMKESGGHIDEEARDTRVKGGVFLKLNI
jgi:hypothetical protein